MFNNTKYIVFEENFIEEMLIFSPLLQHDYVTRRMNIKPISAGFITIHDNEPRCFGKSISLGLESRGEADSKVAKRVLKL